MKGLRWTTLDARYAQYTHTHMVCEYIIKKEVKTT